MNFLAHLFLADDTPGAIIGSLLPDLHRGRPTTPLHPDVSAAADQHRRIDAFTDTHPVVARSVARLRPRHGLFAAIIADVLYDHFLSIDWSLHTDSPLAGFITHVHTIFRSHAHLAPESARPILARMAEQDWLSSYATVEGIRLTLDRMSQRMSSRFDRPVALAAAADELVVQRDALHADFREFFPQLVVRCGARARKSASR